jgi:hypothetical protein
MSVSIALMRSHVRPLCEANRIAINYDRHASASYREREMIGWIRCDISDGVNTSFTRDGYSVCRCWSS